MKGIASLGIAAIVAMSCASSVTERVPSDEYSSMPAAVLTYDMENVRVKGKCLDFARDQNSRSFVLTSNDASIQCLVSTANLDAKELGLLDRIIDEMKLCSEVEVYGDYAHGAGDYRILTVEGVAYRKGNVNHFVRMGCGN